MFKQRFWTALILIPLVLLLMKYANAWILGELTLMLVMIAGWEWLALVPVVTRRGQCLFFVVLCACIWICMHFLYVWLVIGLLMWGAIAIAVLTYPGSERFWGKPWVVSGACFLLVPLAYVASVAIYQKPQGFDLMMYLFALVWATDIGAYLAGKQWGSYRLIPKVSPGKTIEGALGGIILAMIVAGFSMIWFAPSSRLLWFGCAFCTVLVSIVGDLFVSMLKRRCQLKDTGALFPGHGGVLDRMDSFIAAAPFFYVGQIFW